MKYSALDSENVQDERDLRNFRITFSLGIIASSWAMKNPAGKLHANLFLAMFFSVIFLASETVRMYFNRKHLHQSLDKFSDYYDTLPDPKPNIEEFEVDEEKYLDNYWGDFSRYSNWVSTVILLLAFGSFLYGAFQALP